MKLLLANVVFNLSFIFNDMVIITYCVLLPNKINNRGNFFSSPSLNNVYNFSSKITEILAFLKYFFFNLSSFNFIFLL